MALPAQTVQEILATGRWAQSGPGFLVSVAPLVNGRSQLLHLADWTNGVLLFSPVADLDDGETVAILREWDIEDYDIESSEAGNYVFLSRHIHEATPSSEILAFAAALATFADEIEFRLDPRADKW